MVRPCAPPSISVVVDPHKKIIPTIRRILRCRSSPHRAGVLTVNIGLQYPDFHLFPSGLLTKSHYDANSISWAPPGNRTSAVLYGLKIPTNLFPALNAVNILPRCPQGADYFVRLVGGFRSPSIPCSSCKATPRLRESSRSCPNAKCVR